MKIIKAKPETIREQFTDLCEGIRVTTSITGLILAEVLEGQLRDHVIESDEWYQEYMNKHCGTGVHIRDNGVDEISVTASEALVFGIRGFIVMVEAKNDYDHCGTSILVPRQELVMSAHSGAIESHCVIKGHLAGTGMFNMHRMLRMEEVICARAKLKRPEDTTQNLNVHIGAMAESYSEKGVDIKDAHKTYMTVKQAAANLSADPQPLHHYGELEKGELHFENGDTFIDGVNYGRMVGVFFGSNVCVMSEDTAREYDLMCYKTGEVGAFHTGAYIELYDGKRIYMLRSCSPKDWVQTAKFISSRVPHDLVIHIRQLQRTLASFVNGVAIECKPGVPNRTIYEFYSNLAASEINLIDWSELTPDQTPDKAEPFIKDSSIAAVRDLLQERDEAYKAEQAAQEEVQQAKPKLYYGGGGRLIYDDVDYGPNMVQAEIGGLLCVMNRCVAVAYTSDAASIAPVRTGFNTDAYVSVTFTGSVNGTGVYLCHGAGPKDWKAVAQEFSEGRILAEEIYGKAARVSYVDVVQKSRILGRFVNGKLDERGFRRISEFYSNTTVADRELIDLS